MTPRRLLLALCLFLLAAAVAPEAASAAFAQRDPNGTLTVGGGSEQNNITITLSGSSYTISDSAGMGEGAGCDSVDSTTASCAAGPVTGLSATLGSGNDTFSSSAPTPVTVQGEGGQDQITGGSGDDMLVGGPGDDNLQGGGGNDTLIGEIADPVNPGDGTNMMDGGPGNDTIAGGAGPDTLVGGPGDDAMAGGNGDDTLDGGPGADDVRGGPGVDTVSYASATAPVTVTLDGFPGDGQLGEGDNVHSDVENLGGSAGPDTFTGNPSANVLDTGDGEDFVDGGAGPDILTSGNGFDVVRSRDGVADNVDCGPSSDFAIVDPQDTVSPSCERVDNGLSTQPKLGRLALLKPMKGGEAFGLQGMHRTVPLEDRLRLPFGSKLDATTGEVQVTSAASGNRTQSAAFSEGAFFLRQKASDRGLTEVDLTGGDFSTCATAAAGHSRAAVTAARKARRRLFGRGHGRFRSRGRFSTATVRGTQWEVVDRCDGTLTRVVKGTVVVRDLVRHRTVTVKAGHTYLARKP